MENTQAKKTEIVVNILHACMIQVGLVKMIYYKHPVKKHQVKHFKKNDKIYIKTNNEDGTSTILGYCKVETLIPMRVLNGNASLSSMLQLYNDDPLVFKNYRLDNNIEDALPDIERKNLLIVKTARKMVEEYYEYRNLPHLHDKVWRETLGETDSDYAILLQEDFVPVKNLPVTEIQVESQNIRV